MVNDSFEDHSRDHMNECRRHGVARSERRAQRLPPQEVRGSAKQKPELLMLKSCKAYTSWNKLNTQTRVNGIFKVET